MRFSLRRMRPACLLGLAVRSNGGSCEIMRRQATSGSIVCFLNNYSLRPIIAAACVVGTVFHYIHGKINRY